MLTFDPLASVVALIKMFREGKEEAAWARLIFTMELSATVALMGMTGLNLIAGKGLLISLGYGLISSAAILAYLFTTSPLTRGMVAAFPQEIIEWLQTKLNPTRIEHK